MRAAGQEVQGEVWFQTLELVLFDSIQPRDQAEWPEMVMSKCDHISLLPIIHLFCHSEETYVTESMIVYTEIVMFLWSWV